MAITRFWFFTLKPTIQPSDEAFLALWAQILDLCASYTPTPAASTSQVHLARISTPLPQRPHHFLFIASPSLSACLSSSSSNTTTTTSPHTGGGRGVGGVGGDGSAAAAAAVGGGGGGRGGSESHGIEPVDGDNKVDGGDDDDAKQQVVYVLISTYPSLALCSQADAVYKQRFQARLAEMVEHRALRQMDMEEMETIPKLLVTSAQAAKLKKNSTTDGGGVTVTISNRDPLRIELDGDAQRPVPPLDEEISGADVYEVPMAPSVYLPSRTLDGDAVVGGGGGGGGGEARQREEDAIEKQRREGKKWIRISRGWDVEPQDGEVEVFRLMEVISR